MAKANYKTFSVCLTDVANPTAGVAIDKLLTSDGFTSATSFAGSDQIWRWDTTLNAWAKYAFTKASRTDKNPKWRKYNYSKATPDFSELTDADIVNAGETFMFYRAGDATLSVTLSGQVRAFGSPTGYTVSKANYVFMAFPWPIEVKVSDFPTLANWNALVSATSFAGSDQAWRWDAALNQWVKYAFTKASRTDKNPKWRKYNYSKATPDFSELTDDDKLLAGEGFLFYRAGDTDITVQWNALAE